jgi:hypothetical protein
VSVAVSFGLCIFRGSELISTGSTLLFRKHRQVVKEIEQA